MRSFAANYPRLAALLQFGALALAVGALLLIRAGAVPAADNLLDRAGSTAAPALSANCFAGVLADDPIHCRVLQGMHDDGVMTVEGLYEAAGGLWIFVEEGESELPGIFAEIWHRSKAELAEDNNRACREIDEYEGCYPGVLNAGRKYSLPRYLLPSSERYDNISLWALETRKELSGWAGLRQVWPTTGGARGSQGVVRGSGISVAGVDTTNFDSIDCSLSEIRRLDLWGGGMCVHWQSFPNLNIAGWITHAKERGERHFVQVKPPSESATDGFVADAKANLLNLYPLSDGYEITVVPVKHSYDELLRSAIVLNRFAKAPGNSMGIAGADLTVVVDQSGSAETAPLLSEPEAHPDTDPTNARTVLRVVTYDQAATVAALPLLLPLLGIPDDAVRVVLQLNPSPSPPTIVDI